MADKPDLPWVLIRKGSPPWPFATREKAKAQFNSLRFNAPKAIADAALFGPGGEAWYCRGNRWGEWFRDDARRKREAPEPAEPGEAA